jgi:hypothetical protein
MMLSSVLAASVAHVPSLQPAVFIAAAEGSSNDQLSGALINYTSYGVLGLTVLGFLTGKLVPGWLYSRSEKENERLRLLIDGKIYPLVENSTRVTEKAIEVMADINRERRRP